MKKQTSNKKYTINFKRVFLNISIVLVLLFTLNLITNKAEGAKHIDTKSVVICPSDTLWDIAKETCKNQNMKVQNCVIEIKKLNNMEDSHIYVGQEIKIPVY